MNIEEEIKILENALSGALLVPSECAFVNTEIIKICLDTLKTYESWELLIRHEIEKQIRAEVIEEIFNKADKMMNEQINNLNQSPTRNGKMWARYMNTYLGHIKVACGRLKESEGV